MSDNSQNFDHFDQKRPRRLEDTNTAYVDFPIVWVVIGALAALIIIGLIGLGVVNFLRNQSITPTPPSQVLAPVGKVGTPASSAGQVNPTFTPTSQESTSLPTKIAPTKIEVNGYVKVSGTENLGVSMRQGAGTNYERVSGENGIAPEGSILLVLEGPEKDQDNQYTWWLVRKNDGVEGWVVENFIFPSAPPE
ncbi:MAG: hypothetical protein B6242_06295 [Anaerolineaceae bacterium 4572_78]|nr:MAG: hypothetical protein B6242_06295 [Anaerolineaceae bacterium 4572_78]